MQNSCAAIGLERVFTMELVRGQATELTSNVTAEAIDLRGVPRARLVVSPNGRKRLIYEPGSLWAFPPVDLGGIRSDTLDEFLYGHEHPGLG